MQIRPTHYQVQIKIFEKFGCLYSRTKGDHMIYHYPGTIRPIIIPKYKEVPTFVIRNNMRTIGMTRNEYFALLEEV